MAMTISEVADALGSAADLESAQMLAEELRTAEHDYLAGAAAATADLENRLAVEQGRVKDLQAELYRASIAGKTTPPEPKEEDPSIDDVIEKMRKRR